MQISANREPITALLVLLYSVACCINGQPVPEAEGCPSEWVQFNGNCYSFLYTVQRVSLNIEKARELCKDIGADIISIHSQEENSFLLRTFKTKWKAPTEVLLGMFYDSDDDSLKWFDRSRVTFTNWRQGETMEKNMNTCVKMDMLTGGWDTTECDNFVKSATLCKTKLRLPNEDNNAAPRKLMIIVITTFALAIPGLLLLLCVLHKKNILSSSFASGQLLGVAQIRPYSDNEILVDTMESEDYA